MDLPFALPKEVLEGLRREAVAADRKDRERAESFSSMLKTEGWKLLEELLMTRIQDSADMLLQPSNGEAGAWRSEYIKGVMCGLLLALQLPSVTIAAHKEAAPTSDDTEGEE